MAHLRHQGIDFAVFDADATSHSRASRQQVLSQLVATARRNGLKVDKAALAYESGGGVEFFGTRDLVDFLSSMGVPNWTHTLTI
jgi:hypothetical protein